MVHCALEVVTGRAQSLKWEPPAGETNGGELILSRTSGEELHQCKIGNKSFGKWSAAQLSVVLRHALAWLTGGIVSRQFHFVSRDRAAPLDDLTDRARRFAGDEPGFVGSLSSGDRKELDRLARTWRYDWSDEGGRRRVIQFLQRLYFASGFWGVDRKRLDADAEALFIGRGSEIVDRISSYAFERLGQVLFADDLRQALSVAGFLPRDLRLDPSVSSTIERLQDSFLRDLGANLIGGSLILRTASRDAVTAVISDKPPTALLLTGGAGAGKSAVLFETAQELRSRGIPFLPVRFDVDRPEEDLLDFSAKKLGLRADPVASLDALAGERCSVLILDQLDAVRWTAAHAAKAMQVVQELVERARGAPAMTVLAACRTFDLEDDRRLRALFPEDIPRINVGELREPVVVDEVKRCGVEPGDLSSREMALLRNAFTLSLWVEIIRGGAAPARFANRTELLKTFWDVQRTRIREEHGVLDSETNALLDQVVAFLDQEGRLDAPDILLEAYPAARRALFSLGMLQLRSGRVRFAHQAHADYQIALRVVHRVLTEGFTLVEWAARDQSLFRRQQVRQALEMLRDVDPKEYGETIAAFLTSPNVRFHLRQLAVQLLRHTPDPTDAEIDAVVDALQLGELRPYFCQHLLEYSEPWSRALLRRGLLLEWLKSGHPEDRARAVRVLGSCSHILGDELAPALEVLERGSSDEEVAGLLPSDASSDSPLLFDRRLALTSAVPWFAARQLHTQMALEDLVEHEPSKALQLVHAAIDGALNRLPEPAETDRAILLELRLSERQAMLTTAFVEQPQEAIDLFIPLLARVGDAGEGTEQGLRRYDWYEVQSTLLECLQGAAGELARVSPDAAWQLIGQLPQSPDLDRIAASAWMALEPCEYANRFLEWLLAAPDRLALGWEVGEDGWAAGDLISRFSRYCSIPLYEQLDAGVTSLRCEWEIESVRKQLSLIKRRPKGCDPLVWGDGRPRNFYGSMQQVLLEALPAELLSPRAAGLLACWRAKFGLPSRPAKVAVMGGWVRSPIPASYLMRISDSQWRSIARGDWSRREGDNWRQIDSGSISKRSHEAFAASFGDATKRDPVRFVRLALQLKGLFAVGYVRAALWSAGDLSRPEDAVSAWELAPPQEIERLAAYGEMLDGAGESMGAPFCSAVHRRSAERWSPATIDRLARYAESAKDPEFDAMPVRTRGTDGEETDNLGISALNCVRGAAVYALGALSLEDAGTVERRLIALRLASQDSHPAVRIAVQGAARALIERMPNEALALFLAACDHDDDRVLASSECRRFLLIAWRLHIRELAPLFERMIESKVAAVAQLGAECATAAWLYDAQLKELFDRCENGSSPQRLGVARVAVEVCSDDGEPKADALELLTRFLGDQDSVVSHTAAEVFAREGFISKACAPVVAADYARSAAFIARPNAVVKALAREPSQVGRYLKAISVMAARFSELSGPKVPWNLDSELTTLILGLYESTGDIEIRDSCLDAFDALLRASSPRIQRYLDSLEIT